jgi:hypothetical protein
MSKRAHTCVNTIGGAQKVQQIFTAQGDERQASRCLDRRVHVCTQTARTLALVIATAPRQNPPSIVRGPSEILLQKVAQREARRPHRHAHPCYRCTCRRPAPPAKLWRRSPGARVAAAPSEQRSRRPPRRHSCPGRAGEGVMLREAQPVTGPWRGARCLLHSNSRRTCRLLPPLQALAQKLCKKSLPRGQKCVACA